MRRMTVLPKGWNSNFRQRNHRLDESKVTMYSFGRGICSIQLSRPFVGVRYKQGRIKQSFESPQ